MEPCGSGVVTYDEILVIVVAENGFVTISMSPGCAGPVMCGWIIVALVFVVAVCIVVV